MARKKAPRPNRKWYKEHAYATLGTNYRRLYRNMTHHGIPNDVALEFAGNLKDTQVRYEAGRMSRDSFGQWFQEEWYDILYDEYDYDVDDAYPRKSK